MESRFYYKYNNIKEYIVYITASPAENAGLRPGDCIIRVNNQNVSRSQAASVAKLVK